MAVQSNLRNIEAAALAEQLHALNAERRQIEADIVNEAAAMAEAFSSEGRTARSLVLLLINYGIGAGVVIDGRPLRGAHGNVGEIGAYYPLGRPRPSGDSA
jgi:predicted NBD/HSP70 family sugar kinase